jgi:hypothetical protein
MLDMDPQMVDQLINNGHDWADDHITEAKVNIDQVFDFFKNEFEKEDEYVDYEDVVMAEGKKKTGTKLCARGKASAKAKFKIYPSFFYINSSKYKFIKFLEN